MLPQVTPVLANALVLIPDDVRVLLVCAAIANTAIVTSANGVYPVNRQVCRGVYLPQSLNAATLDGRHVAANRNDVHCLSANQ